MSGDNATQNSTINTSDYKYETAYFYMFDVCNGRKRETVRGNSARWMEGARSSTNSAGTGRTILPPSESCGSTPSSQRFVVQC